MTSRTAPARALGFRCLGPQVAGRGCLGSAPRPGTPSEPRHRARAEYLGGQSSLVPRLCESLVIDPSSYTCTNSTSGATCWGTINAAGLFKNIGWAVFPEGGSNGVRSGNADAVGGVGPLALNLPCHQGFSDVFAIRARHRERQSKANPSARPAAEAPVGRAARPHGGEVRPTRSRPRPRQRPHKAAKLGNLLNGAVQ